MRKMPERIAPMLAVLGSMPDDEGKYGFEFKWDGYRAICFWDGKNLEFRTRNNLNITQECSFLSSEAPALGRFPMILDGEVIAVDEEGKSSFSLLQEKFGFRKKIRPKPSELCYRVFDILYLKETYTISHAFTGRRKLLEKVKLKDPYWRLSPLVIGEGRQICHTAEKMGFEGIMAKRLESPYYLGTRSPDWIKVKFVNQQEFVIGGWHEGEGSAEGGIGSLMMGYYENAKSPFLSYAGNVGTGYTAQDRMHLKNFLWKHRAEKNPFGSEKVPLGAIFAKPIAVAEIEFRGWTRDKKLRQASFKGLRIDKNPGKCGVRKKGKDHEPADRAYC